MAKQSIIQRIKNWITGGNKSSSGTKKTTTTTRKTSRVSNNKDSRSVTSSNSVGKSRRELLDSLTGKSQDDLKREKREEAWKKTKEAFKADSSKTTDPKEELRQKARANREQERKDYNKATDNRYNVKGAKDKAEELKRRQNVKSRAFDSKTAKAEAEHAMKYHKGAESFARGAVSGATFGASDLLAKYGTKGEAKKAEEVYQKNKSKGAETAGEVAASLASFGLTSGASKAVVKKALPRTTKFAAKQGAKAAEKLATTKLVRRAAEKEVANAVEKGLTKEATKEAIDRVAKQKAKDLMRELGEDAAINVTTGALMDVNKAATNTDNAKDFAKEMGKSAIANVALGGLATAGLPAAGRGIKRAFGGVSEGAEKALTKNGKVTARELAEKAAKRAANADERISIRDLARENEKRFDKQVEDAVTIEDFEAFGLPRAEARLLAEDRAKRSAAKSVAPKSVAPKRGVSRGNIKPLAETLRRNEFIPRSRNAEWRLPPRSANRVDTSIEGLTKRLDELKGRTGKTEREARAIETKVNDVTSRLERAKWRKEGGADMEAMKKAYRGEYAGFDMSKTTNGHQSDALEGRLEGRTATIVEMSPDEYMERAYRQIFKKPTEKGRIFADIPEHSKDIEKYAEAMRNGEKFPLPYLDYAGGGQEGRHRALAAKMAGIDKIPVVIIDDAAKPKAIIDEVAEATAKAETSLPYEGTPEADALIRNQQGTPLSVDEMAGVDEAMPSTNPQQTAINEATDSLESRVEQLAEQGAKKTDDGIKVNKVSEDAPVSKNLPSGVKQVRSAYDYNNGEKIEDGILTSWNEAWKASKDYSASHATGEKVRQSKVAVSQLNAMDSEAERELRQKLVEKGDLDYEAISSVELYDKVAKQMRDDADRWVKEMIDINEGGALDFRDTPEWQARVQYIMGTIDPSADAASEIAYTEAFKLAQNISSKGGQTLNLRRNFVHLTPVGKRDAILDDLVNILYHSDGFISQHQKDMPSGIFDKRNYIRNLLMEDDAIQEGVKKVVDAGELDDVSKAFTELMLNLNRKNPKAKFDVLQEIRYLNMLGNPKTHIRNVFGSMFFTPIRRTSNMFRSAIEGSIAKKHGMDITKHGGWSLEAAAEAGRKEPKTDAGRRALEAYKKLEKDVLGGAKYETQMYKGRAKTKVGKAVDVVADFNSKLLAKEDNIFRQRAFRENYIKSYNRYIKDGVPMTPKIERRIEDEAIREAQIATFNEYNEFARALNKITRNASDPNASMGARWAGRGLNAIMPFTKVPANLMNQSINYSPLGIAKGIANIQNAAKKGDVELMNKAIDNFASGMTGSMIFGLGMLLGKTTDSFTTNTGKNDPAAKFKKDRGMQNYSFTYKDPETGQGHSFTLDWLVPTSATFFSGVEMANQLKRGEVGLGFLGDWATVFSRLAEPVMETSMLSGLHGMLETMRGGYNGDDDVGEIEIFGRELVQSYINSFVPSLAGQVARTAYSTDKQISGDTDREYWLNQMKSKTGLGADNALTRTLGIEPLGEDTDAYGNVKGKKENTADYVKSGLKNFLSPANIQKVDFSETDSEKLRVYEEAVKNGADPQEMAYLFPKKQYKKEFNLGDDKVKLSNKDLSTYNQAKTTGGAEGMRYALESIMFNRYGEDEKGKKTVLLDGYTAEEKQKLIQQFEGKSIREVEEWLWKQPQFRSASPAEQKKVINGLWTLTNQGKSNASKRVGERAVYAAQGKDVNEYDYKNEVSKKKQENVQQYIDSGILTYEDVVNFQRYAGKTYYYEDEDGGSSQTYFNKKEMMEYLDSMGYSEEQKAALFNSFKTSKAKEYGASSSRSGRGYRRRGYRRYGRGGGGSKKEKVVKKGVPIKPSDFKADKAYYKDMASSLKTKSSTKRKKALPKTNTIAKIEPPKVKFKKYEV